MKLSIKYVLSSLSMIVLCLCCVVAQAKGKTDWDEDGLKGKVKEVRTYNVKENPSSIDKSSIRRIFRYDKNGNRLLEEHYNEYDEIDGVLTSRFVYKYKNKKNTLERAIFDQKKNLIEKTTYSILGDSKRIIEDVDYRYDVNNNIHSQTIFKYDEDGKLTEESHYATGILRDRIVYKYDEKGNVTEESHSDTSTTWENQKFESKYDENGNRVEMIEFSSQGSLKYKTVYKYNEKNKCIEESVYDSNDTLCSQLQYKYNDAGKRIESKHYVVEDGLMERDYSIIDDNGKTTVSLRYNPNGELGRVAVSKLDDKGNPLETMIYCGDDWIFYYGTIYEYEYYK